MDRPIFRGKEMKKAKLVLFSNAIFDSVADSPFPGGIAIDGNKIVYIGPKDELRPFIGPNTTVKDFGDKLITPGFCDAHAHIEGGIYRECVPQADLFTAKSEDECARRCAEFAQAHPELDIICGNGWNLTEWEEGAPAPTRHSLDIYLPDKAVFNFCADGHSFWCNTKAMELADLDGMMKKNPRLPAGSIVREPDGHPSGQFKDGWSLALREKSQKYPEETMFKFTRDYVKKLNSMGTTSMGEVSMVPPDAIVPFYSNVKRLENNGELTLRLFIYPGTKRMETEGLEQLFQYAEFINSDLLKLCGLKAVIDGVPATYTAALLEPYADDPSTKGMLIKPREELIPYIVKANALGLPVRIHAVGDAAVRMSLDGFEESIKVNGRLGLRNAIEHMDAVDEADVPRFRELDVIGSMQPAHLIMDNRIREARCGKERSKYDWGFRRLINAGVKMAFGTDAPVVSANLYESFYMAVYRKNLNGVSLNREGAGDQSLTLAETLKGFTIGGAYLHGVDDRLGTLEAGKYADITVSNINLFDATEEELKTAHCVYTIFNGDVVYQE